MKMPIVSLNAMAMNESVAATCCFKHEHINGHNYETVLSGGTIQMAIRESVKYVNGFDKSWLAIAKTDYAWATCDNELIYAINPKTGAWEYGIKDANGNFAPYTDSPVTQLYCDHTGEECHYIDDYAHEAYYAHVGSTVEHTAGTKNWAGAHQAVRFNS